MRLQQLSVHNYKSLRNVVFKPSQLSVLIGANGAGKSNTADAIDFVSEVFRAGLDVAVRHRGGVENIWYRKERRSRGELKIEVQVSFDDRADLRQMYLNDFKAPIVFCYSFTCRTISESLASDVRILSERIALRHQDRDVLVINRDENKVTSKYEEADFGKKVASRVMVVERLPLLDRIELQPGELVLTLVSRYLPTFRYITDRVGSFRVFQVYPMESRTPGVMSSSPELDKFGGNLPAVVLYLKEQRPKVYAKIIGVMREILPWLEDVTTGYTTDKRLGLYFKEAGISQPWYADEVSDGSVKTLSLLAAIADPRSSLVLLEEPENNMHPWMLRRIYEFCSETAKMKQLIITTHSPLFLNKLQPDQVFVVSREAFATTIDPLTSLDHSESLDELMLGDYWVAGGIPKSLPSLEGGPEA